MSKVSSLMSVDDKRKFCAGVSALRQRFEI